MPISTGKDWKILLLTMEIRKVEKTHKTHNPNTPKWNLTRTLKWKLSQILSKNSLAIALYFSQIGMINKWGIAFYL